MSSVNAAAAPLPKQASRNPWLDEELLPADPIALRRGLIAAAVLAVPFCAAIGLIVWRLW